MSNVIKIDLLKKYKFELGDKVYDVTEPTPEQSIAYDGRIKVLSGDGKLVYEETREFLHILGIPKELGMGLSAPDFITTTHNRGPHRLMFSSTWCW